MISIRELVEHSELNPVKLWQATSTRLIVYHRSQMLPFWAKETKLPADATLELEVVEYEINQVSYFLTRTKDNVTISQEVPKQLTILLLSQNQLLRKNVSYDVYEI